MTDAEKESKVAAHDDPKANQSVFVNVEGMELIISDYGFLSWGEQFFEASKKCRNREGFSPLPYYLICHSLELCLKSYLLNKGWSTTYNKTEKKNVVALRHDLVRVLGQADKEGLKLCQRAPKTGQ